MPIKNYVSLYRFIFLYREAEERDTQDRAKHEATEPQPTAAAVQESRGSRPIRAQNMSFVAITVKCYTGKSLHNDADKGTCERILGLGPTTPYAALGLYFNDMDSPVLYPLHRTAKAAEEKQCLCMAVNNAQLLRSDSMATALHAFRTRPVDPMEMLSADASETERLAQLTLPGIWRYATARRSPQPGAQN